MTSPAIDECRWHVLRDSLGWPGAAAARALSLRVGGTVPPFIDAHAAVRAGERSAFAQNVVRFVHENSPATGTPEAKSEHAKDTDEEETEDGCPEYMVVPGSLPTGAQQTDRHQAQPEKPVPAPKRLPSRHRWLEIPRLMHSIDCRRFDSKSRSVERSRRVQSSAQTKDLHSRLNHDQQSYFYPDAD